jgi:DNA topoisomerase-1
MRNLYVVEAPGKVVNLAQILKSLRAPGDVLATAGQIADNPKSLTPIALSPQLVETRYQIRDDRRALVDKIRRAAENVDRIFIATDDDQEGNVIAYDLVQALKGTGAEIFRMRLKGLSVDEVGRALKEAGPADFAAEAAQGSCRRIVDRAIGAACSLLTPDSIITVGRVQSALLLEINERPLATGEFAFQAKAKDGSLYAASSEVFGSEHLARLEAAAAALQKGRFEKANVVTEDLSLGTPWTYEEAVAEVGLRLRIGIDQAADALQAAYEEGLTSYPRTRSQEFSKDGVELALALARQNRCSVEGGVLPVESLRGGAHEAIRPLDDEMQLGVPLNVLALPEAVAVILARNLISCAQRVETKVLEVQVEGMNIRLRQQVATPQRCWKDKPEVPGFMELPLDYVLLKRIATVGLGRPSTSVDHVRKFLQRDLLEQRTEGWALSDKGRAWCQYAQSVGMTPGFSAEIEERIKKATGDPSSMAREALGSSAVGGRVAAAVAGSRAAQSKVSASDESNFDDAWS